MFYVISTDMAMLKYVFLLHDLPAPVTVQEETVPAAELQKKQKGKYQHFSPKEKATIGRYAIVSMGLPTR